MVCSSSAGAGFVFRPARDGDELEAVFRFRYEHFFHCFSDGYPGLDRTLKRLVEPHDRGSTHYCAFDPEGKLCAVSTATRANASDLPGAWHEWFRLASLGALGLDKTVISTRMVVDPAHRHRIIFPLFYSYIMERYLEAGFEYAVHYCAPGLVCRYEELGHRLYAGPFAVPPGILRVPMLMALYDLDHLWKLNPPLAMLSSTAPLRPKTVPSGVISGICSPPNFRLMAPEERLAYVLDRAEPGCLPEPAALAPPLQFASPLHLKPGVFAPSPRGAGFLGLLLSGTILEGDSGLPAQPGGFIGAGHWLQPASPMTGFRVATEATILVFAQRLAEKVSRAHIVFPGASVWEVLRSASVLAARSRITSTGAKEK